MRNNSGAGSGALILQTALLGGAFAEVLLRKNSGVVADASANEILLFGTLSEHQSEDIHQGGLSIPTKYRF